MFTIAPRTGTANFLQRIFWSDAKTLLLNFNLKNVLNEVKFGGNNHLKRQWVANYFICDYKTMYRALSLDCFLRRQHPDPS